MFFQDMGDKTLRFPIANYTEGETVRAVTFEAHKFTALQDVIVYAIFYF